MRCKEGGFTRAWLVVAGREKFSAEKKSAAAKAGGVETHVSQRNGENDEK